MDVLRLTIIDHVGTVSLVAHSSAALALTAACSHNPESLADLLAASRRYDHGLRDLLLHGLAVFDEHNTSSDTRAVHTQVRTLAPRDLPPFRVVSEETRELSLRPVRAGLVLFNLPAKRIVQIENTYAPLERKGTVNFHNGKFLSIREVPYELPPHWSIVP